MKLIASLVHLKWNILNTKQFNIVLTFDIILHNNQEYCFLLALKWESTSFLSLMED